MWLAPSICAQSRARLRKRPAMRGVPRLRSARSRARPRDRARCRGCAPRGRGSLEVRRRVGGEALYEAEAAAEGAGEQALARGRADERERLDEDREHAGVGARVEGHLDAEVLHRRVEVLLDPDRDPVDLVDEEDVAALQAREEAEQILRLVEGRAARGVELAPELLGHDAGQAGLAEARRPAEEQVVGGLAWPFAAPRWVRRFSTTPSWPTNSSRLDGRRPISVTLSGPPPGPPRRPRGPRVEHVVRPAAVRPLGRMRRSSGRG